MPHQIKTIVNAVLDIGIIDLLINLATSYKQFLFILEDDLYGQVEDLWFVGIFVTLNKQFLNVYRLEMILPIICYDFPF